MTEDEAKTKWCPFARTIEASGEGSSFARNRVARPFDEPAQVFSHSLIGCNCIGSACMAWRPTDNESGPWAAHLGPEPPSKPAGFCGLAGKP